LILFAELNPLGPGGLVTLHDSGGERQLMVDLADAAGVPLTELGADTVAAIEEVLDPELPAVNPLDAWSRGGETAASQMTNCLTLMMQDDGAALGAIAIDRAPDGFIYPSHIDRMRHASELSGKVGRCNNTQRFSCCRRRFDIPERCSRLDELPGFLAQAGHENYSRR